MKIFIFLETLISFGLFSVSTFGEYAPGAQITRGGELYSVTIPKNIDIFKNHPHQKYLFVIDISGDGEVISVEIKAGGEGACARNGEKLSEAIKKWKFTVIEINGKKPERWGAYFNFKIDYSEDSNKCTLIANRGIKPAFSFIVPSSEIRELSEDELDFLSQKQLNDKLPSGGNNIFPPVAE